MRVSASQIVVEEEEPTLRTAWRQDGGGVAMSAAVKLRKTHESGSNSEMHAESQYYV